MVNKISGCDLMVSLIINQDNFAESQALFRCERDAGSSRAVTPKSAKDIRKTKGGAVAWGILAGTKHR